MSVQKETIADGIRAVTSGVWFVLRDANRPLGEAEDDSALPPTSIIASIQGALVETLRLLVATCLVVSTCAGGCAMGGYLAFYLGTFMLWYLDLIQRLLR